VGMVGIAVDIEAGAEATSSGRLAPEIVVYMVHIGVAGDTAE